MVLIDKTVLSLKFPEKAGTLRGIKKINHAGRELVRQAGFSTASLERFGERSCQSACKSFQLSASKSFQLISPFLPASDVA